MTMTESTTETIDVLLIEDNDQHFELIQRRLNRVAYGTVQLERADRLQTGLDLLQRKDFSVVLLDLMLPDSQGMETCRRVVDCSPDTPVIVLSSLDMEEDGVQAVEERADDYLPKSDINGALLLRALRCAVERGARRTAEAALSHSKGELAAARDIQISLLPTESPEVAGFEIAGKSTPAEAVGGDYFDWLSLPNGDPLIAIGDASGHGTPAALVMAQACASIRTLTPIFDDIGEVMTRCNHLLVTELPTGRFMSMAIFQLNVESGAIHYSSGGHPSAIVFAPDGTIKHMLKSTDLLLGMSDDLNYSTTPAAPLEPGDTMVLLTDGVTETESPAGELFGEQRVISTVQQAITQHPDEIINQVLGTVQDFRCGGPIADDVTLVVVRRTKS